MMTELVFQREHKTLFILKNIIGWILCLFSKHNMTIATENWQSNTAAWRREMTIKRSTCTRCGIEVLRVSSVSRSKL